MKILHTSDWHLGIMLQSSSLIDDQSKFLKDLIEFIKIEKIDVIIIAGDIFDSSIANNEAILLFDNAATVICKILKIPMIIIAGNHDGASRLASCSELLKKSDLYISGKISQNIEPIVIENVAFYPIPYFNINEVRKIYPQKTINTYEDAMSIICSEIRKNLDKSKVNIAISHAFICGASLSDSDKSAIIGGANMISKDVFNGFSYVALGHLHRPQSLSNNIRYSGSPLKYSFSEASHQKSFTIFDTVSLEIYTREISPLHDISFLRGEYDYLIEAASYSKNFVKIEITDRYVGAEIFETFKTFYPNLLSLTGISTGIDNIKTTLTIEEIGKFTPDELLLKFFQETFQYTPTTSQIELFNIALNKLDSED